MKDSNRPILIVIGNYKNGGIAKRASVLANGFVKCGKKVSIVVTGEMSEKRFFELNENVEVIEINNLNIDEQKNKYKRFLYKTSIEIKAGKLISRLIRHDKLTKKIINYKISKKRNFEKLKWFLSSYPNSIIISLGLSYAANIFGVIPFNKHSVILATKTYAEGELRGIDEDLALVVLKGMKCVVCQTQYSKDYFNKMGISNTVVIPNPLLMENSPFTGNRAKRIVNFCRISREKKIELLIEAFSEFNKLFPDYRIDIFGNIINGQEEAYKQELNKTIAFLNLSEVIEIHPAVKNIHKIIQDAAMFVSTSEFEGLSNSMIEAMALGIPCICTDCDGGGAREMIEDGVNGLLVPKNDVDSLYEAMVRFAEDEQFAEKCGRNAVKIREKTAVETVISMWETVIEKYC